METSLSKTGVRSTSAQSLGAMSVAGLKTLQDYIWDICSQAQQGGAKDLSMREIQVKYEKKYFPRRLDISSISGRVHNLILADRLERLEKSRACGVTGRQILPVRVPMKQAGMGF